MFKRTFRLDIRKHVFSNRVVNNWNALPENCTSSSTVNISSGGFGEFGESYGGLDKTESKLKTIMSSTQFKFPYL